MSSFHLGFLIVYDFSDDNRPFIIEDDGCTCCAYIRGPLGAVVNYVWLYNRPVADRVPNSRETAIRVNPSTHASDWAGHSFPSTEKDFSVSVTTATNVATTFNVYIRGELFAALQMGETPGRSKLAKKDGPLARRFVPLGGAARKLIAPYRHAINGDSTAHKFLDIPTVAKELLFVEIFQSEVCNGGFHQFFSNSTGMIAPEAVQAFRAIGLPIAAAILEQAMTVFRTPYPRDRAIRQQILDHLLKLDESHDDDEYFEQNNPFRFLDEIFFHTIENNVLNEIMDAYAYQFAPFDAQENLASKPTGYGKICYQQ